MLLLNTLNLFGLAFRSFRRAEPTIRLLPIRRQQSALCLSSTNWEKPTVNDVDLSAFARLPSSASVIARQQLRQSICNKEVFRFHRSPTSPMSCQRDPLQPMSSTVSRRDNVGLSASRAGGLLGHAIRCVSAKVLNATGLRERDYTEAVCEYHQIMSTIKDTSVDVFANAKNDQRPY